MKTVELKVPLSADNSVTVTFAQWPTSDELWAARKLLDEVGLRWPTLDKRIPEMPELEAQCSQA